MKKLLSLFFIFILSLSLVGCNNSDDTLLKNPISSVDYSEEVKKHADSLYDMANILTGFSVVGTETNIKRSEYIFNQFEEIGLSNVKKIPVLLNGWNYGETVLSAYCNCADNSELKIRLIGAYPINYNFTDEIFIMRYIENNSDLTKENIEGYAVMLPFSEDLKSIDVAVKKVAAFNPKLIIICSNLRNTTNLYNIDTDYMQNIDVPIFCVPTNSYTLLKKSYENGINNDVNMELTITSYSVVSEKLTESYFVSGEIKGKTDKIVYVTSHFDSLHNGYMGSCVSTGELISIGHRLINENYEPYYTIKFLATTGQEWGLVGKGQNAGIEVYLNNLSKEEKNNIHSVLVLDGSYPIIDRIYSQTSASSDLLDMVKGYNALFFTEYNVKFLNDVIEIDLDSEYKTEANVWVQYNYPTVLSSEMRNTSFIYNNTSTDVKSLGIDKDFVNYYMNYYIGLLKVMANN